MASLFGNYKPFLRLKPSLCLRCQRTFSTSVASNSGHNKWSKIRHGKAINDAKKNVQRAEYSQALKLYTQLYGADPTFNPQLASAIAAAKKAGVPKAIIDNSIARGQGKSVTGESLENFTYDAVVPPSLALVAEIQTDNKNRALADLNSLVRKAKGAPSSAKFFFTRAGRVVLEKSADEAVGIDEIMDDAIEAGAEDLENDEDGNIVIWTQPQQTMRVCQDVASKFSLKVLSSDIIFTPNEETRATLGDSPELETFVELLEAMRNLPDVQAIYCNVARGDMSDAQWEQIEDNLDT